MPPVEEQRKIVKSAAKKVGELPTSNQEKAQGSDAKRLSGILKIKNPLIIEEIAESDLQGGQSG
jgi:hypothetical protein